jgi:hypothetical protein
VHIATRNETAALSVQCRRRSATSNADHQLVISGQDDYRVRAILTIVAQQTAAIREEKF